VIYLPPDADSIADRHGAQMHILTFIMAIRAQSALCRLIHSSINTAPRSIRVCAAIHAETRPKPHKLDYQYCVRRCVLLCIEHPRLPITVLAFAYAG
ncbi:MAG: hypothetical protein ACLVJ6_06080, partial [Merdibacter sp.]